MNIYSIKRIKKDPFTFLKVSVQLYQMINSEKNFEKDVLINLIHGALLEHKINTVKKSVIKSCINDSLTYPLKGQFYTFTIKLNNKLEIDSIYYSIPEATLPSTNSN